MGWCRNVAWCAGATLFSVGFVSLMLYLYLDQPKDPVFSVNSATVKAYNLTSDNRLFCIINLSVRAHNPNHKKKHYLKYSKLAMEVRKGSKHVLAGDGPWSFRQDPYNDMVISVEAVGLRVGLKKKIAEELRVDFGAKEGRVNVAVSGVLKKAGKEYEFGVNCKDVVVDFSRSTEKLQNATCKVTATTKDS